MSRYQDDGDGYSDGPPNQGELWFANIRRHLGGQRGRAALREVKAALEALPEKRLIEGSLCRVRRTEVEGIEPILVPVPDGQLGAFEEPRPEERIHIIPGSPVVIENAGVCLVGAYAVHKLMQQGLSREAAILKLDPTIVDAAGQPVDEMYDEGDENLWDTAEVGVKHGLTRVLAWFLAYKNDEDYSRLTEEQRYDRFMTWIDKQLAAPPGVALGV